MKDKPLLSTALNQKAISRGAAQLVSVSILSLFLELSLIRWLPAHIFAIAFFPNIILIAAFLGLGLGFLMHRYEIDVFRFFPGMLGVYTLLIIGLQYIKVHVLPSSQVWIWAYYHSRFNDHGFSALPLGTLICVIFVLTAFLFIPLGQKIGRLMTAFEPLPAYSLNLLGSLIGVAAFAAVSFVLCPAWVWFGVIAGIIVFINRKEKKNVIHALILTALVLFIGFMEKDIQWSSYYAIQVRQSSNSSLDVFVNQLFHQRSVNFKMEPYLLEKYLMPYTWVHPRKVLILGAGTGNDVWAAREAGAQWIDAVEIDPVISRLPHPLHPYADHHMRLFVDDARSFMHKTAERYDMVVFGTLDSHASLSMASSIRLDNYIYTRQSLQEAVRLLNADGVIVLLFSSPTQWMMDRVFGLAESAFGPGNARFIVTDHALFNLIVVGGPGLRNIVRDAHASGLLQPLPPAVDDLVPTDDWPNIYLQNRLIPDLYKKTLTVVLVMALAMIFILSPAKKERLDLMFLFLGCGFFLLETKSVTTFSLVFGSTWLVNAVSFSAILIIALLANGVIQTGRLKSSRWFWMSLAISLIVLYKFPVSSLLGLSMCPKMLLSGALISLPIFFSSLIFAALLKRTQSLEMALGSNLIGAVLGGLTEYFSMIWGLNALYIIALCAYAIAAGVLIEKNMAVRIKP